MPRDTSKHYFAAVPGRAIADSKLTALHWRVLAVVASRDRMGRNGQNCWEAHSKMAARIGCDPKRFSTAANDLVRLGYLSKEQHDKDKRRIRFSVVYISDDDSIGMGINIKQNGLRTGNLKERRKPFSDSGNHRDFGGECRNRIYSAKLEHIHLETGMGRMQKGKRYGAQTHNELVKRLGSNGWELLASYDPETLAWLEFKCGEGTLTEEDILYANSTLSTKG